MRRQPSGADSRRAGTLMLTGVSTLILAPVAHASDPPAPLSKTPNVVAAMVDSPVAAPAAPVPAVAPVPKPTSIAPGPEEAPEAGPESEASEVAEGFDNAGPVGAERGDGGTAARPDTIGVGGAAVAESREAEGVVSSHTDDGDSSCSWYASPSGRSSNSGRSSGSPLPLRTAAGRTQPGQTVCLLGGTYYLSSALQVTRSGNSGDYITYRSHNGTADLRWTGGRGYELIHVNRGVRYIEIRGLRMDGNDRANNGVYANLGSHHVRVLYNRISSTGTGGVTAKGSDYTTVHGNRIHHAGYGTGWGSGISINESHYADGYSGFHTFVTNNIVSGTYDNSSRDSDGNGIILDRGDRTPPTLVANNVVFANYGRCIHGYRASNLWVVNNTCFKSNLSGRSEGEFNLYAMQDAHLINNVAQATENGRPFKDIRGEGADFERNVSYGGGNEVGGYGSSEIRSVSPEFSDPFSVGSWGSAMSPDSVGTRLAPDSGSPLLGGGIDPRYARGMTDNLRSGMSHFLRVDVRGQSRPQNGWDIGAYER